ncbi:MAG TPA: hypothetical protein VM577_05515 [Anaerovoracaceae bacterium]|nr:hypothetical protein [Anaerovoracaceae bacterium]
MAKLVSSKTIETLHQRWTAFCQRLGAKNSDVVWEWIKSAYTEPDRYYHNLNHLEHCFQELDAIPGLHLPEIELAIWFHDIVYQTRHSFENEGLSYEVAINAVGVLGLPNGYNGLLKTMIMATGDHTRDISDSYALMLDIDLSILGQSPEVFQEYEKQIRQEYGWVPLSLFNEQRVQILQNFLATPSIYKTEIMRDKYEAQARENLKASIDKMV